MVDADGVLRYRACTSISYRLHRRTVLLLRVSENQIRMITYRDRK